MVYLRTGAMIRLAALCAILVLTGCTLAQQGAFDVSKYGAPATPSFIPDDGMDDSATIQAALNALPASGGTLHLPPGVYNICSTIFIPQRISNYGPGVSIVGDHAVFMGTGAGIGTLLETGTGYAPTSTNWGEPPESMSSTHYGSSISGISFSNCGTAIKVFNFIQKCSIRDCWFYRCDTAIHASRSFYCDIVNNHAFAGYDGRPDSAPIFWFQNTANAMTVDGNSANGQVGSGRTGIGFLWSQGAFGLSASTNAAEGCKVGVSIAGEVRGFAFVGGYLENNDTAFDLGSAGKWGLVIDSCYFNTNTVAVTAVNWGRGRFGAGNQIDAGGGSIVLSDPSNGMIVECP